MGVFDDETMTLINETYQRADAFLFGRRTYELFAGYWGAEERARAAAEDPGNHQIAAALNRTRARTRRTSAAKPFKAALVGDSIPFTSFAVDDVQKEFERLSRLGVRFTQDPAQMGPVTTAVFDDTCGNLIQIAQRNQAPDLNRT
jgi:hypothetical protein